MRHFKLIFYLIVLLSPIGRQTVIQAAEDWSKSQITLDMQRYTPVSWSALMGQQGSYQNTNQQLMYKHVTAKHDTLLLSSDYTNSQLDTRDSSANYLTIRYLDSWQVSARYQHAGKAAQWSINSSIASHSKLRQVNFEYSMMGRHWTTTVVAGYDHSTWGLNFGSTVQNFTALLERSKLISGASATLSWHNYQFAFKGQTTWPTVFSEQQSTELASYQYPSTRVAMLALSHGQSHQGQFKLQYYFKQDTVNATIGLDGSKIGQITAWDQRLNAIKVIYSRDRLQLSLTYRQDNYLFKGVIQTRVFGGLLSAASGARYYHQLDLKAQTILASVMLPVYQSGKLGLKFSNTTSSSTGTVRQAHHIWQLFDPLGNISNQAWVLKQVVLDAFDVHGMLVLSNRTELKLSTGYLFPIYVDITMHPANVENPGIIEQGWWGKLQLRHEF